MNNLVDIENKVMNMTATRQEAIELLEKLPEDTTKSYFIIDIDVQNIVRYNISTENCTEVKSMLAVNYTNLRDNMKSYMDQVTDDYETMIVTRKNNKNVVMMSEEAYNNLMENVYVMGNKANYDWLMESKAQLEKGNFASHTLSEVVDDE